ncbi:MAG: adenylate/guanylate cyclase domain-containing protein [Ardenticatenaceae bacterium]
MNTDFEQSERLVELVIAEAQTILDKVKVYEIRIQSYIAQSQMPAAIDTAREVLKLLGVPLPAKPSMMSVLAGFVRTKFVLGRKGIKHLRRLPAMADPHKLAAMRILMTTTAPAYFSSPKLFPMIVLKMVQLSVQYGNSPYSAYGYTTYGVLLCASLGDINSGYEFGRFGMELLDRFEAEYIKAKVYMVFYNSVKPWKDHARESIPYFLEGYQIGLETGDLEYAALNAMAYCAFSFFTGRDLGVLEQEMSKYGDVIQKLKQETHLHQHELIRQCLSNLKGDAENPCRLVGEHYNETEVLAKLIKANDRTSTGILYVSKSYLCYAFHEYSEAVTNALMAEKYIDALAGTGYVPLHYFSYSLALLGCYDKYSKKEQKRALKQVASNQKKMKRWAQHAPSNFQDKFCLVEAERARVEGQIGQAIAYYDQAIALAQQYEYANEEALANELTARFYLAQNKHKIAQLYLLEARYGYLKWGAAAKVKQIDERYPQLAQASTESTIKQVAPDTLMITSTQSSSSVSTVLDLSSVLKASQAISGEIVPETLLEKMMKIVIENAGAQRGFLILEKNSHFVIEAAGVVDSDEIKVLQSIPIEQVSGRTATPLLSNAIVHYVARTKEPIVLHDASSAGQFTRDPYVIRQQPKSVLCMPLLNRGQLSGILYLENNLTTGAFTPDRLELLKLLSSQAAISIDNARLYANIRALNQAYERFVPNQFLSFLGKKSIIDVKLGDQVEKEMTILFSDIRDFTTISEEMTPAQNFLFVNNYLSRMEPLIIEYNGFVDKYMGDGIMALFPTNADDAVYASIAMLRQLQQYNITRLEANRVPIKIGIGLHTGRLMLGTVGGHNRMDGTVISDAVNLGARVEGLTKRYRVSLLITEQTYARLKKPTALREIDRVTVKGKSKPVTIYEIYQAETPEQITLKKRTLADFELGLAMYRQQEFTFAGELFTKVWHANPQDHVAKLYITRCETLKQHDLPEEWNGVFVATTK